MALIHRTESRLAEEFGGGRLLLSDMRLAFLLMNDARNRAAARLFAVPQEQANLVTLVAVAMLAETGHRKLQRLLNVPSVPSSGEGLMAAAAMRELAWNVAGPPARDMPLSGLLLAIAIVGGTATPAALKSLRAVRAFAHRTNVGFHRRYGYIVDAGHWRQRHAQRHSGEIEASR